MAQKNVKKTSTGTVIGGCTILGIGIGIFFNQVAAGTLIGIGVGMLLSYYLSHH